MSANKKQYYQADNHIYQKSQAPPQKTCAGLIIKTICSFTLLELLIVIAIIAILATLLLPALGKAKNTTKSTVCTGNLRQLSVAMNNYASDYGDWCTWSDHLGNELYGPITPNLQNETLCPYINFPPMIPAVGTPAKVSICPLGGRDGTTNGVRSNGSPNFSYGFNTFLTSGTTNTYNRGTRLSSVKKPSRRVYCADVNTYANGLYSNIFFPMRHMNGSDNMVFVDGHAANWKSSQKNAIGAGGYSGGSNGFWHDSIW